MIQRIQSLYLLVVVVLVSLAMIFPLIEFQLVDGSIARLYSYMISESFDGAEWSQLATIWSIPIAFAVTALLNLVTIFFYKKRMWQIRLVRYAALLKIAIFIVLIYFAYILGKEVDVAATKPQIGSLLLLISLVFDWLAKKAIRKDENLVRSVDRIR